MKKRIYHIISHLEIGGAERVALNIVRSPSADYEYHVVEVLRGRGKVTDSMLQELQEAGVAVHRAWVSAHKLGILLFPLFFLSVMLRRRADVIHSHTELPDMGVYLWYLLFGFFFRNVCYVRTIHSTERWLHWERIGQRVDAFFIGKHADVAIGQGVADCYRRSRGVSVPLVRNGIAQVRQNPFPAALQENACHILYAARLEEEKGVKELVEVIRSLADAHALIFHIVGDGSLKDYLIHSVGRQHNVRCYERIYGIASHLSQFDYLLMPSHFEGLPILSIEASMAGLPVIGSGCAGIRETLPADWPLLVADNQPQGYVSILTQLKLYDRTALASAAQQYAMQHYGIRKMQEAYETIYARFPGEAPR